MQYQSPSPWKYTPTAPQAEVPTATVKPRGQLLPQRSQSRGCRNPRSTSLLCKLNLQLVY